MSNIKNKTFDSLISYYNKDKNLKKFVEVCKAMVKAPNSTPEMRGEVCESVLYVILTDFIERNNLKDWRVSKGLILKDINSPKDSRFLTELDLTLFTPRCIFSFECKSYRGKKYLDEKGTLFVKSGNKYKKKLDVFNQHYNHFKVLNTNLSCALLNPPNDANTKQYKSHRLLYFDFGDIPTEDKREDLYKQVFPICNVNNVYSLFRDYSKRPKYWNMDLVNRVVDIIEQASEKNTRNHLNYVTSLHNRNGKRR